MKISKFSDLRAVFLPSDPAYQSPQEYTGLVHLTADWSGGGLATCLPQQMFKRFATGALPAGLSYTYLTPPLTEQWRILCASFIASVGTGFGTLMLAYPDAGFAVAISGRNQATAYYKSCGIAPGLVAPVGSRLYWQYDTGVLNDMMEIQTLVIPTGQGHGYTF